MEKDSDKRKVLEIPSKIELLNSIEKLIDQISDEYELNQEVYGKVLIAAIEAVNNAIVHGNKLDEQKKVAIEILKEDEHIRMFVEDQGKGFDYANVPDPTLPENIENIHGRGVFLMGHLSDEIHFYDEGRKVEMIFNI